ncbi:unnamed protein product [Strongylus vulgaris]|uniref:GP-PDE domain-containing protein n=1 Tax=Strongylus vulgaris TaxID=40348 RepID=A0A3P7LW34_STRVU|nr:unnamed protein product [Strongylus vulgaris]
MTYTTSFEYYFYSIIDDLIELGIRLFILPLFLGVDMLLLHYKNINGIIDDLIELGIRLFILPLFLGVDMLLLHYKNINGYLVDDAISYGIHVVAWTVNDRETANFLRSLKVPFLSDEPQNLKDNKQSKKLKPVNKV